MIMLTKLEQAALVAQELTKRLKRVAAKATRKVKDIKSVRPMVGVFLK